MESKTQKAVAAFKAGDLKTALKLSKGFVIGVSPYERRVLTNGYEAMVHPKFYEQLGREVPKMIEDAKDLFQSLFVKEMAHG